MPDVTCLVPLDIQMPVMNGLEFLEELRQVDRCSRFPVIVLSGSERIEDARRLPCVVAVVSKPFNDNDLMELIRQEARAIVGDVASLR